VFFKPKFRELENLASASEQELKDGENNANGRNSVSNAAGVSSYLYAQCAAKSGPHLSLFIAILAKGMCFFGPSA
jgi:hypothetical protein